MTMGSIPAKADVAVIGSGATGLAAAVTLAEGGAKVVVFEKQRSLGGTSNFFQGTFAVESEMQRERYIDYTRDEAFKNIMDYSHWRANPRLVQSHRQRVGRRPSAGCRSQGVVFTDATINMPESPLHLSRHQGQRRGGGQGPRRPGEEQGRRRSCPARRSSALLKEGGRICGVVADDDGEEVEVAVKAVVVATGGFANNKEWIKKYTGFDLGVEPVSRSATPARPETASAWPGRSARPKRASAPRDVPGGSGRRRSSPWAATSSWPPPSPTCG